MSDVIVEPCIGVKDASCVEVGPVGCIHEGETMFYIDVRITTLQPAKSAVVDDEIWV